MKVSKGRKSSPKICDELILIQTQRDKRFEKTANPRQNVRLENRLGQQQFQSQHRGEAISIYTSASSGRGPRRDFRNAPFDTPPRAHRYMRSRTCARIFN